MANGTGYKRLQRGDLRTFDGRAVELILGAMARGGEGRISSKGHAILRSPNGQTMSVSRNTATGNRSYRNMQADYQRCFGNLPVLDERTDGALALVPDPEPDEHPLVPRQGRQLLECPVESCEAEFVTEGARYSHVHKEHHPCKQPGCFKVFDKPNKASGHFNVVHGRVIGEFPCEVCGFVAKSNNGLGVHKAKRHGVYNPNSRSPKAPARKKAARKKAVAKKQVTAKAASPQREPTVAELLARVEVLEATVERLRKALS